MLLECFPVGLIFSSVHIAHGGCSFRRHAPNITTSGGCSFFTNGVCLTLRIFSEMAPLLLSTVEQALGLIEGWPMSILYMLFIDEPTVLTIEAISAFFYGNGVPVDLAYQMYEACNRMSRTGVKDRVCDAYHYFQTIDNGCGLSGHLLQPPCTAVFLCAGASNKSDGACDAKAQGIVWFRTIFK